MDYGVLSLNELPSNALTGDFSSDGKAEMAPDTGNSDPPEPAHAAEPIVIQPLTPAFTCNTQIPAMATPVFTYNTQIPAVVTPVFTYNTQIPAVVTPVFTCNTQIPAGILLIPTVGVLNYQELAPVVMDVELTPRVPVSAFAEMSETWKAAPMKEEESDAQLLEADAMKIEMNDTDYKALSCLSADVKLESENKLMDTEKSENKLMDIQKSENKLMNIQKSENKLMNIQKSENKLMDIKPNLALTCQHKEVEEGQNCQEPEETQLCRVCYKMVTKSDMTSHMKSHRESHTCSACGRVFSCRSFLIQHKCRADQVFPYVCEVCGKGYNRKRSLDVHMTLHGVERAHVCRICGEGYSVNYYLCRHFLKSHPDEHFYKCEYCEKTFARKKQLFKHKKGAKYKPYACNYCCFRFKTNLSLETHLSTHTRSTNETSPQEKKTASHDGQKSNL